MIPGTRSKSASRLARAVFKRGAASLDPGFPTLSLPCDRTARADRYSGKVALHRFGRYRRTRCSPIASPSWYRQSRRENVWSASSMKDTLIRPARHSARTLRPGMVLKQTIPWVRTAKRRTRKLSPGLHDALQIAGQVFLLGMCRVYIRRMIRRGGCFVARSRSHPPPVDKYPHDAPESCLASALQQLQPLFGFEKGSKAVVKGLYSPGG